MTLKCTFYGFCDISLDTHNCVSFITYERQIFMIHYINISSWQYFRNAFYYKIYFTEIHKSNDVNSDLLFFGAFFNVVYIFAHYIKKSQYSFQTSDVSIFINGSFIFLRWTFMQRSPSFWYVRVRQNTTQQQYVVFKCYPSTCIFPYTLNDVMIYFVVQRVWHIFYFIYSDR